nr:MAG TPA: hypothetical protein [Caudoviricetes sp.]
MFALVLIVQRLTQGYENVCSLIRQLSVLLLQPHL